MAYCAQQICEQEGSLSVADACGVNYNGHHLLFCEEHFEMFLSMYSTFKALEKTLPIIKHGGVVLDSWNDLKQQTKDLELCILLRERFQTSIKVDKDSKEYTGHVVWLKKLRYFLLELRYAMDVRENGDFKWHDPNKRLWLYHECDRQERLTQYWKKRKTRQRKQELPDLSNNPFASLL